MNNLLKAAIQRGASDIHIKGGDVFRIRVGNELIPMTRKPISPEQSRDIAMRLLPDWDRDALDQIRDYDCSWGVPGLGRFRVNIFRQRGTIGIVLRVIPFEIPTLDALGLPDIIGDLALTDRGLILITGVTGAGKSTTLAAMVEHINRHRRRHVVTLEDPIEFLHRNRESSVTQREIGTDTEGFATGLRAALREDPDVILVGEMRDTETIDVALKAAETGHLVLSTLHTQNAVQTISRIVAVFPPAEQEMIRVRLSETLISVVSQRLLARKESEGRIAACEVMVATGTIRDRILDPERINEIFELIAEGRETYRSQTFDQHLKELVLEDLVEFETAKAAANHPSDFELKMRTLA